MKRIIFLIIITSVFISCTSQFNVVPLKNNMNTYSEHGLVYFLPKTIIEIDVEVTTHKFIPGPYNQYAEKFLSITNASSTSAKWSDVTNVVIKNFFTADSNAAFLILNNEDNKFYFNDELVLLSVNKKPDKAVKEQFHSSVNIPSFFDYQVYFTDYTSEENFTSILDTTYRVIEIDSVFQKIPVYNPVMTSKTIEQKAEEAAEFIIELRRSRFNLISGDLDNIPDSGAMGKMLDKIDEMEQKYLELFTGKTVSVKNSFSYVYTPKEKQENETVSMFFLCDNLGISTEYSPDKYPVYVKFENYNTAKEVNRFMTIQNEIKEKNHGLYYRIPSTAMISVGLDKEVYAKKIVTVPQCGKTMRIPEKIMNNKDFKLQLNPKTGAIERIN